MIGFMNREQIDHLLRSELVGRIGCTSENRVYVVPITYVYEDSSIYGHTTAGMKVDMMRTNPNVCFEVDHVDNLASWQSVIAYGIFEELQGQEAEDALQRLVNRVHPFASSDTTVPRHGLDRPHSPINPHIEVVVYKIRLVEVTGKFEKQ
jgi:nitroimidazol reductase NimA-like FMN-containing flavoprotein (pyridoxamine 5'-phosphate oxidase superfamily)